MLLLLHSTFLLSVMKMLLKGEVGGYALNCHGNYFKFVHHGKSWNCFLGFLWEPCYVYMYVYNIWYRTMVEKRSVHVSVLLSNCKQSITSLSLLVGTTVCNIKLRKPQSNQIDSLYITLYIQPRSYQVSKEVVHELKFGDIAVIQILTICSRVTGILILIGSL